MEPTELTTVTRSIVLDATVDDVWRSIVEEDELSAWFGSRVRLDPVAGGLARFDDGASVRRAVVQAVDHHHRLAFTWWDEAAPDDASTVELTLDEGAPGDGSGTIRLTVTETVATGGASARACSLTDLGDIWVDRLDRVDGLVAGRRSPVAVAAATASSL